MTHLAHRHTKRLQPYTTSDNRLGSEIAQLFAIFLQILYNLYGWIRISFINPYLTYLRKYEEFVESSFSEEEQEPEEKEAKPLVVARGIGLMAAYTGRRAMFAIYPASGEGLEVSSQGPAPISFDYKKKEDLYLVGYVPPTAGRYRIKVARFGRKAVGSPFLLRVDDPPPGYAGDFGASLWHERPPPPPLLSGIVDFVTEKMFLTEDGRLVRLNKAGTQMIPVKDKKPPVPKSQLPQPPKSAQSATQHKNPEREANNSNNAGRKPEMRLKDIPLPNPASMKDDEIKKSYPIKKQVVSRIENLLTTINRDSRKDPQDKYKYVSKALMKELSLSLKLLDMLGAAESSDTPENSPNFDTNREFLIPDTKGTEDRTNDSEAVDRNQSNVDRFLSKPRESRYAAQRPGKLAWYWGDDVPSSQACDSTRQTEAESGAAVRREGLIGSLLQGGRNVRPWRKYGVSGLLGLRKHEEVSGVRLLHNIYRPSDSIDAINQNKSYYKCSDRNLNNNNTTKLEYQQVAEVRSERNNLESDQRNLSFKNYIQKDVTFKKPGSFKQSPHPRANPNKLKSRESGSIGNFRTLSLPDVNRILSLSVQGLRKAKSCSDRSLKAMSSNSFSVTIRGLFDRDQVYNLTKANKECTEKSRKTNPAPTLVRLTHYGSDYDKRKMQCGLRSVDEMKKYWEEKRVQDDDTEFGRGCSLELTGIVDRGKAIFESHPTTTVPEIKIYDEFKQIKYINKQVQAFESPKSSDNSPVKYIEFERSPERNDMFSRSPISNKTAFQKAKDLFEGSYDPRMLDDEKDNRRKSISERFYVSSLTKDLQNGATPELLGVPNRLPAVASLGSVYHPQYPHLPLSPARDYGELGDQYVFPSWNIMFNSDPNYA